MEKNIYRTWAEVDLAAIEHNFQQIQAYVGNTNVLCVIKANAYGHGSVPVAKQLQQAGASYFGVATVPEAVELREQGITLPILILGYVDEAEARLVARFDITAAVYDFDTAQMLSAAAQAEQKNITVHFKLDTGMTRLGFPAMHTEETVCDILTCAKLPGLTAGGIFTHFAMADMQDGGAYTQMQLSLFERICKKLEQAGLVLPIRHCANSGGVVGYQNSYMNMVRAGIILYGFYPDEHFSHDIDLRPALTLKAHVVQVHTVDANSCVSYGGTYTTKQQTKLAVISIGYADGYLRAGSGQARVLIGGCSVPIVGRICMDMCIAELPQTLQVHRGDEVIVYGKEEVTAQTAAKASGTITYEVLCAISSRVPRIYI